VPLFGLPRSSVSCDQTDLEANLHLWLTIQDAIDASEFFVLLASPDAATRSTSVPRELHHWLEHGDHDKLIIALTIGEVRWDTAANGFDWKHTTAIPRMLSGAFRDEPKLVDLRGSRQFTKIPEDDADFQTIRREPASPLDPLVEM
jgi:hypothetical protein